MTRATPRVPVPFRLIPLDVEDAHPDWWKRVTWSASGSTVFVPFDLLFPIGELEEVRRRSGNNNASDTMPRR